MDHKNLKWAGLVAVITLVLCGCSSSTGPSDGNHDGPTKEQLDFLDSLSQRQTAHFDQMNSLMTSIDTTAAQDSMVKILSADEDVESAWVWSQGVWIKYVNGTVGGLMVGPEFYEGAEPSPHAHPGTRMQAGTAASPRSKRTLYLAPVCAEMETHKPGCVDQTISQCSAALQSAGYDNFDTYKDGNCTVDRFANMDGYGFIRIHSHGNPMPSRESITEVFIPTGETVSRSTNDRYYSSIMSGELGRVTRPDGATYYYVSSGFVGRHNELSDSKSFVALGFCLSAAGNWPQVITSTCGGIGCYAYDWLVPTDVERSWTTAFCDQMCDMTLSAPLTVAEWFSRNSTQAPSEGRVVNIVYAGEGGTTLWTERLEVLATNPPDGAEDIPVTQLIAVAFSAVIEPSSCNRSNFVLNPSTYGDVYCDNEYAAFEPSGSLKHNTTYTATIKTGMCDIHGNCLEEDFSWSFTTAGTGPDDCIRVRQGEWSFLCSHQGMPLLEYVGGDLEQSECFLSYDYDNILSGPVDGDWWEGTNHINAFTFTGRFSGDPATSFSGTWTSMDDPSFSGAFTGQYESSAKHESKPRRLREIRRISAMLNAGHP